MERTRAARPISSGDGSKEISNFGNIEIQHIHNEPVKGRQVIAYPFVLPNLRSWSHKALYE
jgi:hypothetical protein